jgi:hypothetical protein
MCCYLSLQLSVITTAAAISTITTTTVHHSQTWFLHFEKVYDVLKGDEKTELRLRTTLEISMIMEARKKESTLMKTELLYCYYRSVCVCE